MKRTNHPGSKTDEWLDLLNGLSFFVSISKIGVYLVSEAGNLGAEASAGRYDAERRVTIESWAKPRPGRSTQFRFGLRAGGSPQLWLGLAGGRESSGCTLYP